MNWIKVNLLDIANPKQWKNISMSELTEDGYSVYGANGIIGKYPEYNHEFPTLAITCRGATCGSLHITQSKSYINSNAMALDDLSPNVDLQFLYYALGKRGFKDVVSGSAQPQITREGLSNIFIDIPEKLSDQIKIANVLSKAEALIKQRKENIDLLDKFLKSTFLKMFGDVTNGSTLVKLGDYLKLIGGGAFRSEDFTDEGIPVIKIGTVNKGFFDKSTFSYLPFSFRENFSKHIIYPGDLLLSLTGTVGKDDYGNTCFASIEREFYLLNQRVAKITVDTNYLNLQFVSYLFQLPKFKGELVKANRGVRQANLNNSDIYNSKIHLPPINIQNQFALIVEKAEALKEQLKNGLNDLENLYGSLSQRAFKGEPDFDNKELIEEEPNLGFSEQVIITLKPDEQGITGLPEIKEDYQKVGPEANLDNILSKEDQKDLGKYFKRTNEEISRAKSSYHKPKGDKQTLIAKTDTKKWHALSANGKSVLPLNSEVLLDQCKIEFKNLKRFALEDINELAAQLKMIYEYDEMRDFVFNALSQKRTLRQSFEIIQKEDGTDNEEKIFFQIVNNNETT